MSWSVFVNSICKTNYGAVVVEASNGKPEGPPFIRFTIPSREIDACHIGKRYTITIEEA